MWSKKKSKRTSDPSVTFRAVSPMRPSSAGDTRTMFLPCIWNIGVAVRPEVPVSPAAQGLPAPRSVCTLPGKVRTVAG